MVSRFEVMREHFGQGTCYFEIFGGQTHFFVPIEVYDALGEEKFPELANQVFGKERVDSCNPKYVVHRNDFDPSPIPYFFMSLPSVKANRSKLYFSLGNEDNPHEKRQAAFENDPTSILPDYNKPQQLVDLIMHEYNSL